MADFIRITEEDIKNAKSFMPMEVKEKLTRTVAMCCVEAVESENTAEGQPPIPPIYRERRWLRQQVSMGVLAEWYLGKKIEHEPIDLNWSGKIIEMAMTMSRDEYSIWASSHVINQMERLKTSRTEGIRDKIYDILYDFKGFENMLFGAIRDELDNRNDICGRLARTFAMQVSEETLKELREETLSAISELKKQGGEK